MSDGLIYFMWSITILIIIGRFLFKYLDGDYNVLSDIIIESNTYIIKKDNNIIGKETTMIRKITYRSGKVKYKTTTIRH